MNFKNHINNFWNYNDQHRLGANVIAFYFFLINICEKKKKNTIVLADAVISKKLSISRNTIKYCRSKLNEVKLLKSSNQVGKATVYIVLEDEVEEKIPDKILQKEEKNEEPFPENESDDIPTLEEFLTFAKTLPHYHDSLLSVVKEKYNTWKKLGWRNTQGRPITDFRATLKATLPFMKADSQSGFLIPTIKRPKNKIL